MTEKNGERPAELELGTPGGGRAWVPGAKPKPGTEEHLVHVTELILEEYVKK